MFEILKGEDIKVTGITVLLYGDPGAGKTSIAFTADKPVMFDFDDGSHRSDFKVGKSIVRIKDWKQVADSYPKLATILAPYNTIVIDTVETALDYIRIYVENNDFKLKKNKLQMYGALKDEWHGFLNRVRALGKNVILIAHSAKDEQNGIMRTTYKITGGSKDIVSQKADFIGYVHILNKKRCIDFNPTDYYDGKNSCGYPLIELPSFKTEPNYFATKITEMINHLNAVVEEQNKSVQMLTGYFGKIEQLRDNDDCQTLLGELRKDKAKMTPGEQKQIWEKIKSKMFDLGYDYIAEMNQFVKEEVPATEEETTVDEEVIFG